jgi:hypothetical protein
MFFKKIPTNLPKVYCKITIHKDDGGWLVDFYWLLAYNTLNKFSEKFEWKWLRIFNNADYIDLDDIYHYLANENFIPISETFFYRDMEVKDQLWNE